jgi:hypothetical protein
LDLYGRASNAKVNLSKTVLVSLSGVSHASWLSLADSSGIEWHDATSSGAVRYLGYPLYSTQAQLLDYLDAILVKVTRHSNLLKERQLSIRGKSLVANSRMYPKGTLRSILKLLLPQILLLYEKIEFFLQIKIKNKKDLIKLQMFIEPYKSLKKIFDDEKEALLYLISNDYVNKHIKCNKCEHETKLNLNKKLYVCRYYKCRKAISPLKGTIFNNLTLPLNTQLHILYLFLGKAPSSFIAVVFHLLFCIDIIVRNQLFIYVIHGLYLITQSD